MNWALAYVVAGACVLAATLAMHLTHSSSRLRRTLEAIAHDERAKPSSWRRVLEGGVVPLLAGLAVLVAWPLVLVDLLREIPGRWRAWRHRERPFRVRRRDLR